MFIPEGLTEEELTKVSRMYIAGEVYDAMSYEDFILYAINNKESLGLTEVKDEPIGECVAEEGIGIP